MPRAVRIEWNGTEITFCQVHRLCLSCWVVQVTSTSSWVWSVHNSAIWLVSNWVRPAQENKTMMVTLKYMVRRIISWKIYDIQNRWLMHNRTYWCLLQLDNITTNNRQSIVRYKLKIFFLVWYTGLREVGITQVGNDIHASHGGLCQVYDRWSCRHW